MPGADRAELLAGRLRRHHLDRPAAAPAAADALTCGFQDSGDGTGDASLALRCGGAEQVPSAIRTGELVAALTLRGAPHLHRAEDLAMLRSAMSSTSTADLEAVNGPMDAAIRDRDDPVGEIADAIGHTVADQHGELSKADLSTAVTQRLDDRILVYCARCAARHAPDGLFRLATLRAGLVLVPGTRSQTLRRYAAAADTGLPTVAERTEARRRLCAAAAGLSEPHHPGQLAGWLGWDVASVRATEAAPDRAPRSRSRYAGPDCCRNAIPGYGAVTAPGCSATTPNVARRSSEHSGRPESCCSTARSSAPGASAKPGPALTSRSPAGRSGRLRSRTS